MNMRLISLTLALLVACGITAGQTPPVEDDDANIIAGKPVEIVTPERPHDALDMSGVVRINVKVDKKGKVTEAYPLSGPAVFHAASEKAARDTRFTPATRDKKPVP